MVLSDMDLYALKAERLLKDVIPSFKHITCISRMLHLDCETFEKNLAHL